MYGLSPETDLSPLRGCVLTFIGFGEYQFQLGFSGASNCAITIEGDYVVTSPGLEAARFRKAVDGAAAVLPILGHTVTTAEVPTDGTVRVCFDDGSVVEILDSEEHFESYQINLCGRFLVV